MPMQRDEELQEEYAKRIESDPMYQMTKRLADQIGDTDSVYWRFEVEIQTNSTLPMDKQTLANLYLRLAQINITEQSIVDAKAVLDGVGVPDSKAILARQEKRRKEAMMAANATKQMSRQPGPKRMPMGLDQLNQGQAQQGGAVA
jgi:hypothetical protein